MTSFFRQKGTTTVEFAIIGSVAIICLLASLEIGRLFFVLNSLKEASRRGARMAAVCPLNDPAIAQAAIFDYPSAQGGSPVVHGLTTGEVTVNYLDVAGTLTADFRQIRYVRVGITGYQIQLLILGWNTSFNAPNFASTLPRESLGIPRQGVITAC